MAHWSNQTFFDEARPPDGKARKGTKHLHVEFSDLGETLYNDVSYIRGQPTEEETALLVEGGFVVCEINQRNKEPTLHAFVPNKARYFAEVAAIRAIFNKDGLYDVDQDSDEWVKCARDWFDKAQKFDARYGQDNVPNDITSSMARMVDILGDQLRAGCHLDEGYDAAPVPVQDNLILGSYMVVAPKGKPQFHMPHAYFRTSFPASFKAVIPKLQRIVGTGTTGTGLTLRSIYQVGSDEPFAHGSLLIGPIDHTPLLVIRLAIDLLIQCGFYGCYDVYSNATE